MEEEFDKWNEVKKQIDQSSETLPYFPQEREVWICILGKNIGVEQNGGKDNFSRPVLIVKRFNNQMFWCVPLSSKQKNLDFYYNFVDQTKNRASVILAQLKLVSIKRLKRKISDFPNNHFLEIRNRIKSFF